MTHRDLDPDSSSVPWSGQAIAPQMNGGGNFFFSVKNEIVNILGDYLILLL